MDKYKCSQVGVDAARDSLQQQFDTIKQEEASLYLVHLGGIPFEEAVTRFTWEIQNDKHSLMDNRFGKVFTINTNTDNMPYITIDTERYY